MRVLLIYSNQSRELVPAPPIGLSYVATATQQAGHKVRFLDLAFSTDLLDELKQTILDFRPDIVGLSVRNIDNVIYQRFESPLAALQQQIAVIRQYARSSDGMPVPLALGGPAISILNERALSLFGADYAIIGEGESTFPMLLNAIEERKSLSNIPGLCYSYRGVTKYNPSGLLRNIGDSGMQQWVDWRCYQHDGSTWPIQTKRGCPMSCVYCAYPLIEGKQGRLREPAEVVDEIERVLHEVRPRTFEFVDSTFNIPSSHAIAICEELIRRKVKASFTAMGINPSDVPRELFPLMKRAGFNSMMITPEAGCAEMLKRYAKGFTMNEITHCLEHARHSGIMSMWFFMLGGPGETEQSCEETIRFAETALKGRQFMVVFFTGIRILPDTALARYAIKHGYLPHETDLSEGVFYLSPQVSEQQIINRINRAIINNPSIVHAADGSTTRQQTLLYRSLNLLRVAPPYWRFIPSMLAFPPLRILRNRAPSTLPSMVPG